MADDPNTTDWARGQPAPWLAAYGDAPPAPELAQPVVAPPVGAPPQGAPPPAAGSSLTPEEEANIEIDQPPGAPAAPLNPTDWSPAGSMVAPGQSAPFENQVAQSASEGVDWKPSQDRLADLQAGSGAAAVAERLANQQGGVAPGAAERQRTIDQLTPEDQAKAIASMTPDELATWKVHNDRALVLDDARRRSEIAQEDQRRAAENLGMQQAATAKADAEMKQVAADALRISNTHINPKRYTENTGIVGTIGRFVALAVGGGMSQYTGGRNLALEQFNKSVESDVDAQKSDIANQWQGVNARKGAIAAEYERHGDLYKAQETYRLASTQSAIVGLQAEEQQYDPAGTTAARVRDSLTQLHAQQQQQAMAVHAYLQKQNLELIKGLADAGKSLAETRSAKQGLANPQLEKYLGFSPVRATGTGAPAEVVLQLKDFARLGLPPPKEPMTLATYEKINTARKGAAEGAKADVEAQGAENASRIVNSNTGEPLLDKQGKPVVMPPEKAIEENQKLASTQQSIDSLGKVRRALAGDPSALDRKEWAGITAQIGQALPTIAASMGSKFTSREEEALKDIMQLDYDSYFARVAKKGTGLVALDVILDTMKANADTYARGVLHAKDAGIVDMSRPPAAVKTEIDKLGEALSTTHAPRFPSVEEMVRDPSIVDEIRANNDAAREGGMPRQHVEALNRLEAVMSADITQHSGRWWMTGADGADIAGPFEDREAAIKAAERDRDHAAGVIGNAAKKSPFGATRDAAAKFLSEYNLSKTTTEKP